jgi:hypothetical protein
MVLEQQERLDKEVAAKEDEERITQEAEEAAATEQAMIEAEEAEAARVCGPFPFPRGMNIGKSDSQIFRADCYFDWLCSLRAKEFD